MPIGNSRHSNRAMRGDLELVKGLPLSFGFLAMFSTLLGYACIRAGSAAEREHENLAM